jgi:hypothetical protein
MKTIRNIINHTLKNKHGKWSRKSIQMFVSFTMANIIGLYIVISHHFAIREISRYAIDVFFGLLGVSVGTSVLTVWDKAKQNTIDKLNDQDEPDQNTETQIPNER